MDENMQDIGALVPKVQHGAVAHAPARQANVHRALSPVGPEPFISQATAGLLDRFTSPHADAGFPWEMITPAAKAEAQAVQAAIEDRTREATYDDWFAFLLSVALCTANAPSAKRDPDRRHQPSPFEATVAATTEAMGYVPICALHAGKAECMREEFFPKPAALTRILSPHIRRAMGQRAAISRIATGQAHVSAGQRVRAPEEIEAVKAKAAAFAVEMLQQERARRAARLEERGTVTVINPRTRAAAERIRRGEPLTTKEAEAEQDARLALMLGAEIESMDRQIAGLLATGVDDTGLAEPRRQKARLESRLEFLKQKVKTRAYDEERETVA